MSIKQKSGLHKEISSIFNGVPLPDSGANERAAAISEAPSDNESGHIPPRPVTAVKPPEISSQEEKAQPVKETVATPKKNELFSRLNNKLGPVWQQVKIKLLTPPEGVSQGKHMATLAAIPILLVVVLVVFGRLFLKGGSKGAKKENQEIEFVQAAPKTEIAWEKPRQYPASLRDPMTNSLPSSSVTTGNMNVVVRGIVWSEDKPAAIIGTEIVYKGEMIQDLKIVDITRDSVEFEQNGKTWTQKIVN